MDGPIEYLGSFPIDLEAEGDVGRSPRAPDASWSWSTASGRSASSCRSRGSGSRPPAHLVDPEHGIDRTFMVLGSPSVIGIRVVSLSGTWIDTTDLPIASGKFRLAVRRR